MMRRIYGLLLALTFAAPAMAADRVPGEHWMRYADPADAGFDPAALEAAKATWESMPSSAFMVVADGAVVAAWGEVSRRYMCHSVRKSFLSALYGIYWDRREIELNKTLADLGIDDAPDPLLPSEKQARILDLLKARSGVFHPAAYAGRTDTQQRGSHGPGRYFAYNNWDFNTLVTVFEQETGRKIFEAFDEHFARPLGMEDWRLSDGYYHYELDKSIHPAYPFRMSARDAARFGLLFTNEGVWGDTRILSRAWVRRTTSLYSDDSDVMGYGMLWWVFREPRFARHGMVAALGYGRHMIAALPDSGLVIVNRADTFDDQMTPVDGLWSLVEAVLAARTGEIAPDPVLVPFQDPPPDPRLEPAPGTDPSRFVGQWPYPPPSFGMPRLGTIEVTVGDEGLVMFNPVAGTFREYPQADGSLLEEDSFDHWVAVRSSSGSIEALANAQAVVEAAGTAAVAGDVDRADSYLALFDDYSSLMVDLGRATVTLLRGERDQAEADLRELLPRTDPGVIEGALASTAAKLAEAERPELEIAALEVATSLLPESSSAWQRLGEARMERGDTDGAVGALSRALELDQRNQAAKEMMEKIRRRQATPR